MKILRMFIAPWLVGALAAAEILAAYGYSLHWKEKQAEYQEQEERDRLIFALDSGLVLGTKENPVYPEEPVIPEG